ncbi:MAG TPA: 6-phosphofructokinase, partial [Methylomirabilota bacterium]|nr:6-phosphofructokinase [Methylomirabilota bacterium]
MERQRLGILVGGGPAPGINSVIAAATIRARLDNVDVIGIEDGFEWLMQGDPSHTRPLTIENVSRIHFRGGSAIGISRANPTRDAEALERTVRTLRQLGVTELITIGGDDTAFSSMRVHQRAKGIRVAHVPKTIDNDLE